MNTAPTSWTLDTLKVVVETEINSLEQVMSGRFTAVDARATEAQEAIKVGLAAAQKALDSAAVLAKDAVGEAKQAHAAEHVAQAMALALAQLEMKERLLEMNAFRKQLSDERGDFVSRDRLSAAITTVESLIATQALATQASMAGLDIRITHVTTKADGLVSRFNAYGAAFAVGVILFELFLRYVIR